MRRRRAICLSAALLVGAVSAGGAAAVATERGAVPSKLAATWNRNVKQTDYNRFGQGQEGFLVGIWTMGIRKNGGAVFYTPGSYRPGCVAKSTCFPDFSVTFAAVGSKVTLASSDSRICVGKVAYGFKVAGTSLTLKVIGETKKTCAPYEALLDGVWKHARA